MADHGLTLDKQRISKANSEQTAPVSGVSVRYKLSDKMQKINNLFVKPDLGPSVCSSSLVTAAA